MSLAARDLRSFLIDPVQLCQSLGLVGDRIRRQTRGLIIACPWHSERTPSCSVRVAADGTIAVRCHGCGATGDALDLVAVAYGLDVNSEFSRVMEAAAGLAGVSSEDTGERLMPPPMPPEPERADDDTFARIADVIERECPLSSQADVCRYLASRNLLEIAGSSLWALPGTWDGLNRVRDAIIESVGEESWVISGLADPENPTKWHSPSHGLCIPWRGENGAVQTIQRRIIGDGRGKYVWPIGRKTPRDPFGVEDLADLLGPVTEIVWVEGAIDALAMRALSAIAGLDRVVLGVPGATIWSQAWAKRSTGRVTIVATDNDEPGHALAERIADDCYAAGACGITRSTPTGEHKDWAGLLASMRLS